MLVQKSDFFKAALKGDFEEARNGKISLPEGDAEIFVSFVDWLYCNNVWSLNIDTTVEEDESGIMDADDKWWDKHFRLYLMADQYSSVDLMNQLTDFLIYSFSGGPHPRLAILVPAWERAAARSQFRVLLMDMAFGTEEFKKRMEREEKEDQDQDLHQEQEQFLPYDFVLEACKRLSKHGAESYEPNLRADRHLARLMMKRCQKYHVHTDGTEGCHEIKLCKIWGAARHHWQFCLHCYDEDPHIYEDWGASRYHERDVDGADRFT